jgi:uncharacterized protein YqiB (DUF1249 family)
MTIKKRNPMATVTGKVRLGPLNFRQLHELLSRTSKPKEKARIKNRIFQLEGILGHKYIPAVVK